MIGKIWIAPGMPGFFEHMEQAQKEDGDPEISDPIEQVPKTRKIKTYDTPWFRRDIISEIKQNKEVLKRMPPFKEYGLECHRDCFTDPVIKRPYEPRCYLETKHLRKMWALIEEFKGQENLNQ